MKRNISMVKPIGFFMLLVLFASFMATINVSVVQASPEHLVINEFIIQPTASEAIELYNPTVSLIDLSTWILSDRPLFSAYWPTGEGNMTLSGTIAAGGYKVFTTLWGTSVLGNEGDDLYLYDNSTGTPTLVDSVAYGPQGGCPEPEYDWSAARAPNGVDTDDDAMDWNVNASTGPTMGSANDAPPAALSESPMVINEVLANPSGVPEFIELYNNGSGDVNITGWFFSDGDDTIVINETSIVPGYGFWVVYSNDSIWVAAEFMYGLENDEDNVYLFNSTGHRLDQMGWTSDHGDGTSVARFSDGVGKCYAYNDTTLVENGWAEERTKNGSPESSNDCTHIWITRFYARPSFVRMYKSNYSLVYASIANMREATTTNVNLTLVVPSPNVTITPPNQTKVELGNLVQYERRTVVWNVTVQVEGSHLLTLMVNASNDPDPRPASTVIRALPKVDIVFDMSHGQYYDTSLMSDFIDMMRELGFVYVNYDTITADLLVNVSLLVITSPNAPYNFTDNEAGVIQNYVDNGGSLWIGGTWYRYVEPYIQNNVTLQYGIEFIDSEIWDNDDYTDYKYHPIIYTWPDNPIANLLSYNVEKITYGSGNMLNITESGPVPVATGDTDPWPDTTWAGDPDDNPIAYGTDVIPFAAVNLTGGGRIFATGSSGVFSNFYMAEAGYDNKQFARNVLAWLLRLATGEANFTLSTLYNVTVKTDLTLKKLGTRLVARFHTYSGVYQGNATVWSGSTPTTVSLAKNVTIDLPVQVVTLVLTDDSGNIWGAITSFVVRRPHLSSRLVDLDILWALGYPRPPLFLEIIDIDTQWPYAPP